MPNVIAFDGGLSLRIDPSLIKNNQAQHLVNVDTNPIILKSSKNFTKIDIPIGHYAKKFANVWLGSNKARQYVEYENILYFTEDSSEAKYYHNGSAKKLGIDRPTKLNVTDLDTLNTGKLSAGTIKYILTYYNSELDIESAGSDISDEKSIIADKSIRLRNLPVSIDSQVTHKRLYRLGANLTSPTLVAEIENSKTIYIDDTPDTEATRILTTTNSYPAEIGMTHLVESYSIFFGLVNNELRFSNIDEPHGWPPENSFKLREIGTGLLVIPQGILIFTNNLTYLLRGNNLDNFTLLLISEHQGCINGNTCSVVKNAPLWVSYDGICTFQNGYVQVISKSLLGKLNLSVKQSTVYDEQYILLKQDGSILILDMRHGIRFYELKYDTNIDGLAVNEGKLYFISSGYLNEAFTGDLVSFDYTSPVFTEGNHTEIKIYNKIYLKCNGAFKVKIFIDETLVLTKDVSGDKTFELTPPVEKQRGYNIYVSISGIGKVYSINIKPLGAQYGN
jgi:hypothetical protein